MLLNQHQIHEFHKKIFSWWDRNRRDLPWRLTHDPYKILVSELMLQQTQVSRVLPKYLEFIEAYPTVKHLAAAPTSSILKTWKGMGYNRRALYLKKTAEKVVTEYQGKFPSEEKILLTLPGLGRYTARALMVFAYQQNVAMVDTNIRKIITHFFFDDQLQTEAVIQSVADQLVPQGKSWDWHQALMDYGALEMKRNVIARSQILRFAQGRLRNPLHQSSLPFKQTNRFFRGRIVDRLREGSIEEVHLINELEKKYRKEKPFLQTILRGLEKDGLVVNIGGTVSLPL